MNDRAAKTSRRRPAVLAAVVGLVPAVPIIAGILLNGQSKAARGPVVAGYSAVLTKSAPPQLTQRPPGAGGTVVALLLHGTTMRVSAGGPRLARLTTRTEFGSPEAMWVVRQAPGWLGVVSPLAGNGRIGWIPRAAATLVPILWELKVSLSARRLTVLYDGDVVRRYTVAIGRPDAPTPTGRFAVTDRLNTGDPTGPYGCCILALSAHSPHAIQGWGGGNRIAIHSTPDASSIGLPVSHGCMRLTLAEGRWLLDHIPLGTPTLIGT
jgi:L,D-transpeptidase catalytic domain